MDKNFKLTMDKPKYYKAVEIKRKFGAIFDSAGFEIDEQERGLDGECEVRRGAKHCWLLIPGWTEAVKTGGKQYIICLECGENSHL